MWNKKVNGFTDNSVEIMMITICTNTSERDSKYGDSVWSSR